MSSLFQCLPHLLSVAYPEPLQRLVLELDLFANISGVDQQA
jgi:hypothetical protein